MQQAEFTNTLKKLWFIDRQPWMSSEQWFEFQRSPADFFRRADDETAGRLWSLIQP